MPPPPVLESADRELAEVLASVRYAPILVVTSALDLSREAPPRGFGFLVPRTEGLRTLGNAVQLQPVCRPRAGGQGPAHHIYRRRDRTGDRRLARRAGLGDGGFGIDPCSTPLWRNRAAPALPAPPGDPAVSTRPSGLARECPAFPRAVARCFLDRQLPGWRVGAGDHGARSSNRRCRARLPWEEAMKRTPGFAHSHRPRMLYCHPE